MFARHIIILIVIYYNKVFFIHFSTSKIFYQIFNNKEFVIKQLKILHYIYYNIINEHQNQNLIVILIYVPRQLKR